MKGLLFGAGVIAFALGHTVLGAALIGAAIAVHVFDGPRPA